MMASSATSILKKFQIVSYNLNGLNQGSSVLGELCNSNEPDIIFVQEHWQTPSNMDKIHNFSGNYMGFGISAMEDAVTTSVLRGRPYGGVAILVNKSLTCYLRIKLIKALERTVLISLGNTIFVNVYLPYKSPTVVTEVENILDEISGLLHNYQGFSLVFGGDLNTDIHVGSDVTAVIRSFMNRHHLNVVDFNLDVASCVTYRHKTLPAKSYVDFLTVSDDLINDFHGFYILDHALELSDHQPIILTITEDWFKNNSNVKCDQPSEKPRVANLRWDHANLSTYYEQTYTQLIPLLNRINNVYTAITRGNCEFHIMYNSQCLDCKKSRASVIPIIEEWYNEFVQAIARIADECIPKLKVNALKFWWSQEASDLKSQSIYAHRAWINAKKPQQGFLYEEQKANKFRYKLFLKKTKENLHDEVTESLLGNLATNDHKQFWKKWKKKFGAKPSHPKIINGIQNEQAIADLFANAFIESCTPLSSESHNISAEVFHSSLKNYPNYGHATDYSLSVELIESIIQKLKLGKAASFDKLTAEHLKFGHPCLIIIMTKILNLLFLYEYIPEAFGKSVTFPIPKSNKSRYEDNTDNYRGISISPIISKVFENCLLLKFGYMLNSSPFQFGFKSKSSCSHAHYVLQNTIDYFNERGSTVNICSLDMSKAFDRLNGYVLLNKLLSRKCPLKFINILSIWFKISCTIVKWGECYSKTVYPITGARQGSILSPLLFSVYVDDMLKRLNNSKLGCQVKYIQFNSFMYADDLLLVSLSIADLQKLLAICESEFAKIDMSINASKSSCVRIGPRFNVNVSVVLINNNPIQWSSELKYLGMTIMAGKNIKYNFHPVKAKFFGSINNIIGKVGTRSTERVVLHLMYSKCSPILTYGLEAVKINKSSRDNLSNVHNSIYAKIFKTFDKLIIKQCQYYSGYLPFEYSLDLKRLQFLSSISQLEHSPACVMFNWFGVGELTSLKLRYKIPPQVLESRWKPLVWSNFESSFLCG